MKKIRYIFFTIFTVFLTVSFAFNSQSEKTFNSPWEEITEDNEAEINQLLIDLEDDLAYVQNTRRADSKNNKTAIEKKSFYPFSFGNLLQMERKRKVIYVSHFDLQLHDEIVFLHLFRLF